MKTELNNIGTWDRLHYDFLYRNQRSVIKQSAEIEGVTEQLKAADQMEWIRRINSIRSRAREFVLKELIYQ